MLSNKPLPNFFKAALFIAVAGSSTTAFAVDHGEAITAKDAIEHAKQDEKTVLKEGAVTAEDKVDSALKSDDLSTDEMINELKEKANSVTAE